MRAALGMDAAPTLASVAVKLKKPTACRYSAVCLFRWSGLERCFKTLRNTLIANIGVLFPLFCDAEGVAMPDTTCGNSNRFF
jgi:hypothetical protein